MYTLFPHLCKVVLSTLFVLLPPGQLDVVGGQSVQGRHLVLLVVLIAHVSICERKTMGLTSCTITRCIFQKNWHLQLFNTQ